MKYYLFKMRLAEARDHARRLLGCGPSVCLRLVAAVCSGLVAVVALVALILAALCLLVPIAAVVIVLGGVALAAWPFASKPAAPAE